MTKKQLQSKIDELKIEISLLEEYFRSRGQSIECYHESEVERYRQSVIEDQKMYNETIMNLKEENETLKKMLL